MKARQRLRRYHIRRGWLVGLPLLVRTVSGLVMRVELAIALLPTTLPRRLRP